MTLFGHLRAQHEGKIVHPCVWHTRVTAGLSSLPPLRLCFASAPQARVLKTVHEGARRKERSVLALRDIVPSNTLSHRLSSRATTAGSSPVPEMTTNRCIRSGRTTDQCWWIKTLARSCRSRPYIRVISVHTPASASPNHLTGPPSTALFTTRSLTTNSKVQPRIALQFYVLTFQQRAIPGGWGEGVMALPTSFLQSLVIRMHL